MIKKNIATNEMGFVFNPATGDSYSMNPTASLIIKWMKEGKSSNEIKKLMIETFEVDKISVEKDFEDFMNALKEQNLLML
ncbi:MAG: PqqD family protein [Chitinophagaceae bacterium]